MRAARSVILIGALVASFGGAPARAQSEPSQAAEPSAAEEAEAGPPSGPGEAEPAPPAGDDVLPPEVGASAEQPSWWFGAYVQGAWVPAFMLKLFLDEAPTVGNVGFGVMATHRDESGFSVVMGLGYAGYGFDGPFRISGDPEQDTEYLHSTLGLLHLRGQMLWSTQIVPNKLGFEYGIGIDLGLVLGSLHRTEAYRLPGSDEYHPCVAALQPAVTSPSGEPYCEPPTGYPAKSTDAYDAHGAHYHVREGRVPPVALVPMLPVLGLRYTPIRQLAIKFDFAFGLMQFTVGLSAAYGIDT